MPSTRQGPGGFQHSQLGSLLAVVALVVASAANSLPGFLKRYHIAKKWWWFIGVLAYFAYHYLRPFIRSRLGSASHAYINYRACYIIWLCSALVYHTPSLEALGLDVRTDLSLAIVVCLASSAVLISLALLHAATLRLRLLRHPLVAAAPGSGYRELLSALLLNSVNLALVCSAYHSLCGNGLAGGGLVQGSSGGTNDSVVWQGPAAGLQAAVCAKWLHPLPTSYYPRFAAWMLYGEGGGSALHAPNTTDTTNATDTAGTHILIDIPLDGRGPVQIDVGAVLSPVLTLWITLVMMYLINTIADHAAATELDAAHMAELRRPVHGTTFMGGANPRQLWAHLNERVKEAGRGSSLRAGVARRAAGLRNMLDVRRPTFKTSSGPASTAGNAAALGMAMTKPSTVAAMLSSSWKATAGYLQGQAGGAADSSKASGSERMSVSGKPPLAAVGKAGRVSSGGHTANSLKETGGASKSKGQQAAAAANINASDAEPSEIPQPDFLDMVPWYSGTSADLVKTCFDLIVSVKLFLGRFDMRTLQAATGSSVAGGRDPFGSDAGCSCPAEGDGYTYEQYSNRGEMWLDFIADTGDGGNSTYTVARALAAPQLHVRVPPDMPHPLLPGDGRGQDPSFSRDSSAIARGSLGGSEHATPASSRRTSVDGGSDKGAGGSSPAGFKRQGTSSVGFQLPITGSSQAPQSVVVPHGPSPQLAPGGGLLLPRADCLVLGGDLAYPNPTKETYEGRLLRPFQDALPPPPHYHPGRMVVHKPDLPPSYGVQASAVDGEVRGLSPRASRVAASAALRSYPGPAAFAIPGNHDWIDGLETFTSYIHHKGWLGGWLLPQEKSYWALQLPHGWWIFGLDLALTNDIDACQLRYFADVVEQRVGASDGVVLVTHEPCWLLEWFWQKVGAHNLRQLVRGHLRGRARLHLAGDLHFYMRHSFVPAQPPASAPPTPRMASMSQNGTVLDAANITSPATQVTENPTPPKPPLAPVTKHAATAQSSPGATADSGLDASKQKADGGSGSTGVNIQAAPSLAAGIGPLDASTNTSTGLGGGRLGPGTADTFPRTPSVPANLHQLRQEPASGSAAASVRAALSSSPPSLLSPEVLAASAAAVAAMSAHGGSGVASKPKTTVWGRSRSGLPGGGGGNGNVSWMADMPNVLGGSSDDDSESVISSTSRASRRLSRSGSVRGVSPGASRRAPAKQLPALKLAVEEGLIGGLVPPPQQAVVAPATDAGKTIHGPTPLVVESTAQKCASCLARQRERALHSFDPEHFICNGSGGAFLHPTHVFAPCAFTPCEDPAATATAAIYSAANLPCTCAVYPHDPAAAWAPSTQEWGAAGTLTAPGAKAGTHKEPGRYTCRAAYPSPERSLALGRRNLHLFRSKNTRFDIIGGMLYFLLVVSVIPRCPGGTQHHHLNHPTAIIHPYQTPANPASATTPVTCPSTFADTLGPHSFAAAAAKHPLHPWGSVAAVLDAETNLGVVGALAAAYLDTLAAVFTTSYVSLLATLLLFLGCLGLARSGGVGAVSHPTPTSHLNPPEPDDPEARKVEGRAWQGVVRVKPPLLRVRMGGFAVQMAWAGAHALLHLSTAVCLMVVLEVGLEMCVRLEGLGQQGHHTLFHWYMSLEEAHFPDPRGVRALLSRLTFGAYPGVIKWAMAIFDIPESVAVVRTAMCTAGGSLVTVTRLQAIAYYGGTLAYYWLLAVPAVGAVFGMYLYISVVWGAVHYDEAFSSLRITHHKAVTRMHITSDGDLEVYSVGVDRVPGQWVEDPAWRGPLGGGNTALPAHAAAAPSRWRPAPGYGQKGGQDGRGVIPGKAEDEIDWYLIDYLKIPRVKP